MQKGAQNLFFLHDFSFWQSYALQHKFLVDLITNLQKSLLFLLTLPSCDIAILLASTYCVQNSGRFQRAQVKLTSSRPPTQHLLLTNACSSAAWSICTANLNRKGVPERQRNDAESNSKQMRMRPRAAGPRLLNPRWELQHLEKTVLVITVHWGKVREPQCTSGDVNSCQECWWVLHRFQNCLPSSTQQRSDNSVHINVRPRAKCNLRLTAEVKLLRASRKHPQ